MSPCSRDHIIIRSFTDVRRMVSEDSDQVRPGLSRVHPLSHLNELHQTLSGLVTSRLDQLNASCESLKVSLLRGVHRMLPEERDDDFQQIPPPSHDGSVEMLFVVVGPGVDEDLTDPEDLTQLV